MFYALGSDGTVGANKESVKIIGDEPDLTRQGYFVYDSKKSGSMTVSHLRFGPERIRSTYLVDEADIVACHQFGLLDRFDVLADMPGGTFLLNAPYPVDEVWEHLPRSLQRRIVELGLRVFTIDAARIARELGMPGRINTVMQPCFFALADVMPVDRAIAAIKGSIKSAYGRRGRLVVERNNAAVDLALGELTEVVRPSRRSTRQRSDESLVVLDDAAVDEFVEQVTLQMIAGRGDLLPVSAMPVDGTYPTGTTRYEKRRLAPRCRSGSPICASTAASARSCARTPRSG